MYAKFQQRGHFANKLQAPQRFRSTLLLSDLREAFVWAAAGHNLKFFFDCRICV